MASSSSAFLSLSCIITRLASEAKVGLWEEVAEPLLEEEGGESTGALLVWFADKEEPDTGLERGWLLEIWGAESLDSEETLLDVGLEDTAGDDEGFFSSTVGVEVARVDGGEEWDDFLGSDGDADLSCWEGAAETLSETGGGGIREGEGRGGPSGTGHDPWVLTAAGVDGKSLSIVPGINKRWEEFVKVQAEDNFTLKQKNNPKVNHKWKRQGQGTPCWNLLETLVSFLQIIYS